MGLPIPGPFSFRIRLRWGSMMSQLLRRASASLHSNWRVDSGTGSIRARRSVRSGASASSSIAALHAASRAWPCSRTDRPRHEGGGFSGAAHVPWPLHEPVSVPMRTSRRTASDSNGAARDDRERTVHLRAVPCDGERNDRRFPLGAETGRTSTTPADARRCRNTRSPKSLSALMSSARATSARCRTSVSPVPGPSSATYSTLWPSRRRARTISPSTLSSATSLTLPCRRWGTPHRPARPRPRTARRPAHSSGSSVDARR